MAIAQLEISHFRNLEQVSLFPSPKLNIILGKNGSGKTSLLEAINFLGSARSFRTPHSKHLISFGREQFVLFAKLAVADVPVSIGIAKDKDRMSIKIANQVVCNSSALAELLPVQVINPDVHKLLEDGPRYRRRFIEWGVFHVKQNYFGMWQQCRHILKQRNAALKQNLPSKEIRHWDIALVEISEQLTTLRQQYLVSLQPFLDDLMQKIKGLPDISIRLEKGWPKSKTLEEALKETIESDKQKGFTQYGPHRADLKILIGSMEAKHVVSRGQQKLVTALMKVAQTQYLENEERGATPVLLIDDLPAELDQDYREDLMKEIAGLRSQVFVTATDRSLLEIARTPNSGKVFHVEHGKVTVADHMVVA